MHSTITPSLFEHRELGSITWLHDYDVAMTRALESGKPMLLLFQEVPGCTTCTNFGHDVLGNPLMAELIEDRFVPVAIHNNKPGRDAQTLRRLNDAGWNNPVVYFLYPDGRQIVPKLANRYDPMGLYQKLHAVLEALDQDIPEYFQLLRGDLVVECGLAMTATFETPCFWSGETTLAQYHAVLTTQAGWIGGEEVVRIHFDPHVGSIDELNAFATAEGFTPNAKVGFRIDKEPQYYLSKSPFAHLPLSPSQRTRINLAIPYRDKPERFLSPQQTEWHSRPEPTLITGPQAYRGDFMQGWRRLRQGPLQSADMP